MQKEPQEWATIAAKNVIRAVPHIRKKTTKTPPVAPVAVRIEKLYRDRAGWNSMLYESNLKPANKVLLTVP